eukprot:829941-Amorphochlora_amoeboformis.AAC.3
MAVPFATARRSLNRRSLSRQNVNLRPLGWEKRVERVDDKGRVEWINKTSIPYFTCFSFGSVYHQNKISRREEDEEDKKHAQDEGAQSLLAKP